MPEDLSFRIGWRNYFVEAVHVELADEGEEVVVFEVLGEDFGGQASDASDYEGVALGGPADYVGVGRVLGQPEVRRRCGMSWPGRWGSCLAPILTPCLQAFSNSLINIRVEWPLHNKRSFVKAMA
jgi:hypothetical protein